MASRATQKRSTRDRVRRLQVTVSAEERAGIEARAEAVGLSVSAFLRAAGLTQSLTERSDHQAIRLLAGLHGELGRIETLPAARGLQVELVALRARLAAALERLP
jgi:hypothetical protein